MCTIFSDMASVVQFECFNGLVNCFEVFVVSGF